MSSDFVESDCDSYHGAMERLLQGSSARRSQPASSSPMYEMPEDPWKSYDKYWSRDQDAKQNTGSAVKRFTTSGGSVLQTSRGFPTTVFIITIFLSYPDRSRLLSSVYSLYCDVMSSWCTTDAWTTCGGQTCLNNAIVRRPQKINRIQISSRYKWT